MHCAVHYSAHRHGDGTWKAARDCPIDGDTGRLLGLVSRAGHGIYPTAGVHARVFLVANDITANSGRRWGCRECIILATPGSNLASGLLTIEKLVQVADRGAPYTEPFDGSLQPLRRQALTAAQRKRQFVPLQGNDSPATVNEVQVCSNSTNDWSPKIHKFIHLSGFAFFVPFGLLIAPTRYTSSIVDVF